MQYDFTSGCFVDPNPIAEDVYAAVSGQAFAISPMSSISNVEYSPSSPRAVSTPEYAVYGTAEALACPTSDFPGCNAGVDSEVVAGFSASDPVAGGRTFYPGQQGTGMPVPGNPYQVSYLRTMISGTQEGTLCSR